MEADAAFLHRAAELALQAQGNVSPNPAVGAVIVRDGVVVGEGHTQPPGQAHAEAVALAQAGDAARGATMYVTLEPCPHFGRTPPCADAVVQAGIARVHIAALDPAPWSNGKGKRKLEEAGIATVLQEDDDAAWDVNAAYFKFVRTGMPFVTVKFAMTLDGKIATRTGDSRWISGEESRAAVHLVRAHSDAIMAGIGTVLADDPQLTTRDAEGNALPRQPLRVIVDSRGRTPQNSQLFRQPGRTLVAVGGEEAQRSLAWVQEFDAEVIALPAPDGRVDFSSLLGALGERDVINLIVEGGGTVLGSLFDGSLVDRVMGCISPVLVGGADAPGPVLGQGVAKIAQAHRLDRLRIDQRGDDIWMSGYVAQGASSPLL